ncbi:MAG: hypothetical protein JW940_37955, partial [Polyangiaceae bacterium]|nr:hypothetical protein [Polyangiaceae bacterium]
MLQVWMRGLGTLLRIVLLVAGAVACTAGCGVGEDPSPATRPKIVGATSIRLVKHLPPCSGTRVNAVYYVEETEEFHFCDGDIYRQIDVQGLDGADGVTWLVEVTPDPPRCPYGGALVTAGPDADADGEMDAVTTQQFVCNGAPGPQGEAGPQGAQGPAGDSCSVMDDGDGTKTIACDDGTSVTVSDGADGQDGADGADGSSCSVTDDGDGTKTIAC